MQMDILQQAQAMSGEMSAIYRELHAHPELSFKEYETMKYITRFLTDLGLEVKQGGKNAGLSATLSGGLPGKTVGIRADIDGLPIDEETGMPYSSQNEGAMHACGHDSHMTMLLCAAKLLCANKEQVHGKVKFIFQQAEEIIAGAQVMIDDGVLENPHVDEIIGLHVVPTLEAGRMETMSGVMLASSDMFEIKVFGSGGHGSAPHVCVDPVIASAHIVIALQNIANKKIIATKPVVVNVCQVVAGSRYNIVPDEAYMSGTIRTHDMKVRNEVFEQIQTIANGVCATFGTTCEVNLVYSVQPTINDSAVTEKLLKRSSKILSDEQIKIRKTPYMFSEDFSCFGQHIPASMFFLGTYNEDKGCTAPLHSAVYKIDEDILPLGAAIFANYCMVD